MQTIKENWLALDFVPERIVRELNDNNIAILEEIKRLSASICESEEVPNITSSLAIEMTAAVDYILAGPGPIDSAYLDTVAKILEIFPRLLVHSPAAGDVQQAQDYLTEISILHELFGNKISSAGADFLRKKMFGAYLIELGFVDQQQIDTAIDEQKAGKFPNMRLGHILEKKGLISRAQLDEAMELHMIDSMGSV